MRLVGGALIVLVVFGILIWLWRQWQKHPGHPRHP
jgi:hypothetical protein